MVDAHWPSSAAGGTPLAFFLYGMVGWLLFGDELPEDWGNVVLIGIVLNSMEEARQLERELDVRDRR